jgi:hypothetical protein
MMVYSVLNKFRYLNLDLHPAKLQMRWRSLSRGESTAPPLNYATSRGDPKLMLGLYKHEVQEIVVAYTDN